MKGLLVFSSQFLVVRDFARVKNMMGNSLTHQNHGCVLKVERVRDCERKENGSPHNVPRDPRTIRGSDRLHVMKSAREKEGHR